MTAATQAEYEDCEEIQSVWCVIQKPFELKALEQQLLACCDGNGHS